MNTLNLGTRIGTMILDHIIMTFIISVIVAPGMVYDMMQAFGDYGAPTKLFLGNYYLNIFGFSLYFNKDIFLGRSLAKRIFKFQLVNVKNGRPAGPLRCLVRNLTTVLWPVEAIVALINQERRIGDFIAGTKLTAFDPETYKEQANWILIVTALVVGVVLSYFMLFYPIELLMRNSGLSVGFGE